MISAYFSKSFHHRQLLHPALITSLESAFHAYHNKVPNHHSLIDDTLSHYLLKTPHSYSELIELWREILAMVLLADLAGLKGRWHDFFEQKIRQLSHIPSLGEDQLINAFADCCCALLHLPLKNLEKRKINQGIVPSNTKSYVSRETVASQPYYAEIGILWSIIAQLLQDEKWIKIVESMAEWHLHTLDHDFFPFVGAFTPESQGSLIHILTANYLLFLNAGKLSGRRDYIYAAERQLEHLQSFDENGSIRVMTPIIETWLGHLSPTPSSAFQLPATICDERAAVLGNRSEQLSWFLTMQGKGSGFGSIHKKDLRIVSFGPQHLPLGNCLSYGIESLFLPPSLAITESEFSIKGTVCSSPETKAPADRIWIDAKMSYRKDHFEIESTFMNFEMDNFAFVFFVKAQSCYVDGQYEVKPRSLENFQGKAQKITLIGKDTMLVIQGDPKSHMMQVIPLSGRENFWGADFLIAFLQKPDPLPFKWTIFHQTV